MKIDAARTETDSDDAFLSLNDINHTLVSKDTTSDKQVSSPAKSEKSLINKTAIDDSLWQSKHSLVTAFLNWSYAVEIQCFVSNLKK